MSSPARPQADVEERRLFDSPGITALNAVLCIIGALSIGFSTVLVTLSLSDQSPFGSGEFAPSFILVFPLWAWMFVILSQPRRIRRREQAGTSSTRTWRMSWATARSLVPRPALVLVPVVFGAAWVLGMTSINGLKGQPGYDASRHGYFENDHGSLIPVSHATYVHAVATQNRLFLAGSVAFTVIATAVTWGEWNRRRALGTRSWPSPATTRPRWIPTLAGGIAVLAVGLTIAVFFAHVLITRISDYQSEAPRLNPRGSTTTHLTAGDYVIFAGCTQSIVCPAIEASEVHVRGAGGSVLPVKVDPSHDHLTFATEPYVGVLSFSVPRAGHFFITMDVQGSPRLVVIHAPGQEALALTVWIAGGVCGILLSIYGLVVCFAWYRWRFARQPPPAERQLGPPPVLPPWPPQEIIGSG